MSSWETSKETPFMYQNSYFPNWIILLPHHYMRKIALISLVAEIAGVEPIGANFLMRGCEESTMLWRTCTKDSIRGNTLH